ncbi:ABC transporter substrate-binding protein [Helicobacter sp. MIT 05-5293]|uniref:MetQ/NlpA family ABC transporter substrate-binding protein n=1 Tax=Helicobacter sp. MIT 05-5293 TaxID=1548149 RepID=UPI0010FD7B17|nr:MetQ/NlpA family ABC transporter substrate-binding protein [Helicobacter sp. MIT 05-5293]TLD80989.1 ABC transporter substrate-binding protein [Helicobacter sp. MIT 05-5293]
MKKIQNLLLAGLSAGIIFAGCGDKETKDLQANAVSESSEKTILKVGATPVPHAEILEVIKSDLSAQGIELQIVNFTDYVTPNVSLNDGSIDANFHQHKPFLDSLKTERGFDLEPVANIHIEPIGFYSKKFSSVDEIPNGSTIAIPNDPSNGGRALILLHHKGLITLKDVENLNASEIDIIENPRDFKIKPIEAAMIPRTLDSVDAAVINGNYALQAGLKGADALFLEGSESPYANILVVKSQRVDDPAILKLKEALQSQKVKDFILEKYQGEVLPVF